MLPKRYLVGEVRPSQVLFTYGIGSIVDLPHISAIVLGLDDWRDSSYLHEIRDERLLRAIKAILGPQVSQLRIPPTRPEEAGAPSKELPPGIPVATFPRWMLCPECRELDSLSTGMFSLEASPFHPDRTHYIHQVCPKGKKPRVVPARFLAACENGHLDDFPWMYFSHGGPTTCQGPLELHEHGPAGEARDLEVRCTKCNIAPRRLSDAFGEMGRRSMPSCRGRRPHLRDFEEGCEHQARAILLGASNLWFADIISLLSIPEGSAQVDQLVEEHWDVLQHAASREMLPMARGMLKTAGKVLPPSDDEIWQAIERRRNRPLEAEQASDPLDLKRPEWALLTAPHEAPRSADFQIREAAAPQGFEQLIERVVLVEKLREVRALLSFSRLDARGEIGELDGAAEIDRMQLSRNPPTWVPAAEVRGEGIFIQLREEALAAWEQRQAVRTRSEQFCAAHRTWRAARRIDSPEAQYPGMRYVLLHSLAHALMRQLTLECGYTAASVRERIYAHPAGDPSKPPMAGLLIYTAAPDSEGTLGGLVSLGEPAELKRHLEAALRDATLCASDPLCAERPPDTEGLTLHAAACHACQFAPETSCERGNRYLDRSTLVTTLGNAELALFGRPT